MSRLLLVDIDGPVHPLLTASKAPGLTNHTVNLTAPRRSHHFDTLSVGIPGFISRVNRPLARHLLCLRTKLQGRVPGDNFMLGGRRVVVLTVDKALLRLVLRRGWLSLRGR